MYKFSKYKYNNGRSRLNPPGNNDSQRLEPVAYWQFHALAETGAGGYLPVIQYNAMIVDMLFQYFRSDRRIGNDIEKIGQVGFFFKMVFKRGG